MFRRLDDEFGVGKVEALQRALVRQVHDTEDAGDLVAAPGFAEGGGDGALVILLGERLQVLVHGAGEVLLRRRLGLGALRLGDLDEELRGLAIDHHDAVAGQEDDGIGAQPRPVTASSVVRCRI